MPVPDLDSGLAFCRDRLGHRLLWRHEGAAGLALPDAETELVLTVRHAYEPNWKVASADDATRKLTSHGAEVIAGPHDIPIGRLAVVRDPFGNPLVVLDSTKGRYQVGDDGNLLGVR